MIILEIADIHGDVSKLEKMSDEIKAADLVLLAGDITNFGRGKEMRKIIRRVREKNPRIFAVPGNCDFPEVESVLNEEDVGLHGQNRIVDGIGFIGLGASLPTPSGATPWEVSEDFFQEHLDKAVTNLPEGIPTILVSHQPPFDTVTDKVWSGAHVGSKVVREFIEKRQPMVCFTGHIHEGVGHDTIGDTRIVNPGALFQRKYAYAEIDRQIEILDIRNVG
ncbi:MAG: hypothetical protein GY866_06505 [Proteobacteria bacterium]|nr:hypothetical protein [Pseudomonadota bacterium]